MNQLAIDSIQPNPLQPRTIFEPDRLNELAQSIRANGIIQPIVVQRIAQGYQLVAGERRWRAARLAGLTTVPAVIQEFASDRLLEVALIENIQREDLNPIEVAHALDRLARDYKLTHEQIASRTGKDRTTVTNLIRLLRLPHDIQLLLAEHRLSMGHARALLGLSTEAEQIELGQRAAAQGLSVRQVERLVHTLTERRPETTSGPGSSQEKPAKLAADPNVEAAQKEMEGTLGTRVRIVSQSADRGRIEIEYFSIDELDRIYNLIVGK
ncbi:MAG: ParB/RepB/Spo0J family partition protein [Bryobacteraceae bacterium]|nr:ParB/RepB/Spo0J family partition protein [Bryobacteraceae bacterium]